MRHIISVIIFHFLCIFSFLLLEIVFFSLFCVSSFLSLSLWSYLFTLSTSFFPQLLLQFSIRSNLSDNFSDIRLDKPLHPKAKEKPQEDGRRDEIRFRIKPHTRQRHSEGSNKPCVHQDPETPQRLSQNWVWVSPAEVWVSSGLLQGQGLCMQ